MTDRTPSDSGRFSLRDALMLAGGVLVALLSVWAWTRWGAQTDTAAQDTPAEAAQPSLDEVTVSHDLLGRTGIETVPVVARPLVERLQATGVVEANQERIQQVTPLLAGRVERVDVVLGSRVQAGMPLLTLSSPQIAELQGNVLAAEARLMEADRTLARQRQLVELGAGAGKDLIAAEAEHRTARAQVAQLRESLQALGAVVPADATPASATVTIRAPMSGTVIERVANPGAWFDAGASLLRIANLSTVWVIVNVPEARLPLVRVGAPAEIRAPFDEGPLLGRVSYIGAELDPGTRTARVRVEVSNTGEALKIGMFVNVTLEGSMMDARRTAPTIPSQAVQRIGERTVVFVATEQPERFEVRDVELGDEAQGVRVVRSGLMAGERVVRTGGFTLKSQLLKGQFGEEEEIAGP